MKLPQEFIDKYKNLLGTTEYKAFIKALNQEPKKAFRLNPLKYDFKDVKYDLTHPILGTKYGYYGEVSGKSIDWVSGYVYSQDPSAMFPARALDVKPGQKVLDLCAAPGGKTTALASALDNQGLLVANEISKSRSRILRENLERWGASNCLITNDDSEKIRASFPEFFDAILVDAPCSGEGMFRKNPDAITYWSQDYVLTCQKRQKEILNNAVKTLKPGGRLVYSTCTYSPEEDEQIVDWLVDTYGMQVLPIENFDQGEPGKPEWTKNNLEEVKNTRRFWPQDNVGEGQFVALLKKPGIAVEKKIKHKRNKKRHQEFLNKNEMQLVDDFLQEYEVGRVLTNYNKKLIKVNEHVVYFAYNEKTNLYIINNGVDLGVLKKNRFEPSYQLAQVLGQEKQQRVYEINTLEEFHKYLHGEVLKVDSKFKGFVLVSYQSKIFSFGKVVQNTLKNYYPKGLRTLK